MEPDDGGAEGRGPDEAALVTAKIEAVLQYFRAAFPGAVVLYRVSAKGDCLITVDPYASRHRYFVEIAKTFLSASHPSVEDLPRLLDGLQLWSALHDGKRYFLH